MERGLKAAALFALIVVASADRALLAGKPSGGALHGVAVVSFAGTGAPTTPNYFITNGNGSWTYSYYSNNGVPNGNNAGQGGVSYADVNTAFSAASAAAGTIAATSIFTTAPNPTATVDSYVSFVNKGITRVAFPSRNLGVAVGAITVDGTNAAETPSIVLTIDGGLTWMAATGLPATTAAAGLVANAVANTAPYAYPVVTAGDLTDVFFATKSVGWAVGANTVSAVGSTTSPIDEDSWTYGLIYMTTNGATVWKAVPLVYTSTAINSAFVVSSTAASDVYATFMPGGLFGVQSDAAGKNVYAVGAPGSTTTISDATTAGVWEATVTYQTIPTILYSGDSGASWVSQSAPATTVSYGLAAVAVQKGTTAWAVGGNFLQSSDPTVGSAAASADNSNGQIIYTTNGGFSWIQAVYPSSSGSKAPFFNAVALNNGVVWVGGFTRSDAFYPVAAVAGAAGITASNGFSTSILVSLDGKTFVSSASFATFPAGFTQSAASGTTIVSKHVMGITWDNNVRGYVFGAGFILATQDGGRTWVYETPADVVSNTYTIATLANVPTTY